MNKNNSQSTKNEEEIQQISLGLEEPKTNLYYKLKRRVYLQFKYLETYRFVRSFHTWLLMSIAISLIAAQFNIITQQITDLPNRLPLITYYSDLESRLVDKEWLYSIPAVSIAIILITIIPSIRWFNRRSTSASFSLISMTISVGMLTYFLYKIIFIQI